MKVRMAKKIVFFLHTMSRNMQKETNRARVLFNAVPSRNTFGGEQSHGPSRRGESSCPVGRGIPSSTALGLGSAIWNRTKSSGRDQNMGRLSQQPKEGYNAQHGGQGCSEEQSMPQWQSSRQVQQSPAYRHVQSRVVGEVRRSLPLLENTPNNREIFFFTFTKVQYASSCGWVYMPEQLRIKANLLQQFMLFLNQITHQFMLLVGVRSIFVDKEEGVRF